MRLRYLGFCGIDDSVSIESLMKISNDYPFVEWGILFRSEKQGSPRYASIHMIERLCLESKQETSADQSKNLSRHDDQSISTHGDKSKFSAKLSLNLAAHLCGDYCENLVKHGDFSKISWLVGLGIQRFQLNPTDANNVHLVIGESEKYVEHIRAAATLFPQVEFIIQANAETASLWTALTSPLMPHNISILFDASCGTGAEISSAHAPLKGTSCGYAGGIGPSSITRVLHMLSSIVGEETVWIDMESSLRSVEGVVDKFNLDACQSCITTVVNMGLV